MSEQLHSFRAAVVLAGGQVELGGSDGHDVVIGDIRCRVRVIAARVVFPRDAKSIAWSAMEARTAGEVPVVAAELVSEGAREFFRSQKIGYSDAGGSLFLPLPRAFVLVDKAPPKREKRVVKGVLSGKTSLAVHALMSSAEPMKGVDIAALTGLSLGGVSAALDKLDRMGWLATQGSGPSKLRRIVDRRGLLEQWKVTRQSEGPVPKERFFVPGAADADVLARRVAEVAGAADVDYMISGVYGAQMHAPYLSSIGQVACRLRKEDIPRLAEALGARKVSQGWNLGLIASEVPMAEPFRLEVGGLCVASPLVCWIDTIAEGGRARELADHLASERLMPSGA